MHLSSFILLPALAAAQEQVPFAERIQGWFNQAKELLPTAKIPQVTTPITPPTPPKAAVVRPKTVTQFNPENWKDILAPKPTPQEWLIYVTGGNKTCFGQCGQANRAWKEAQNLFATSESPNLGRLNCETQGLLCAIWSVSPPTLWHIQVPSAPLTGEEKPSTSIHPVRLNATTVTADEIYKVHSEKLWEKEPELQTMFHPFNGLAAEYRINELVGYIIYCLGMIPSWAMMVGISFISRTMMSRRIGRQGPNAPGGAAPAPAR
ncbi:putative peptidyl-tRNA hydrolase [Microsporum audouinii]